MFLPDVTNSRSPTTFAPAVRPTSCLIEPRYSTFGDITASARAGAAGSAAAGTAVTSASIEVVRNARRALISSANASRRQILRPSPGDRARPRDRVVALTRLVDRAGGVDRDLDLRPELAALTDD